MDQNLGFLAGHIVATVICCIKRMAATCLLMIGNLCVTCTIIVASLVKQW